VTLWRELILRAGKGEAGLDTIEYLLILLFVALMTVVCMNSLVQLSAASLGRLTNALASLS
jgi:Flp pilus assembly pilin Flp